MHFALNKRGKMSQINQTQSQTQSPSQAQNTEMENNIEIKEVQQRIVEIPQMAEQGKATEDEFLQILRLIAPGTNLRTTLEGIVKIGKGAIIVVENEFTPPIMDGGFKLNCRFTPQKMMELSKMDGALILSKDMKKIVCANVLLTPDSKIPTSETGTRHKAAERTAKMTGTLVIAVSERKNEINVYYKNLRHTVIESDRLLRKTNEHLQLLEKQKELFTKNISYLTKLELRNFNSLNHAVKSIQKGRIINQITDEIQRYIVELGKEGILLKTRLKELLKGVEKETELIIKDYTKLDLKKSKTLLESLSYEELLDEDNILKALAYESTTISRNIKGWRIMSKTSLEEQEIAAIVKEAGSLGRAINSPVSFYKKFLSEDKAAQIKEEIEQLKLSQEIS